MTAEKKVTLILFAGQSNMAGRGIVSDTWPENAPKLEEGVAYEYRSISAPGKLFPLCEPFGVDENNPDGIYDVFSNGSKAKTGSMVSAFCEAYYNATNEVIVGVSASKGGSSLKEWQPGDDKGYLEDALNRYISAREYLFGEGYEIAKELVIWCQGETDGDLGTSENEYISKFNIMWNEMRKIIPNMFLVKIGQCNIEGAYDRYDTIRNAQDEIISCISGVHLVSDSFYGMREIGLMKDAFHYYQAGYNIVGKEAAENVAGYYTNQKS